MSNNQSIHSPDLFPDLLFFVYSDGSTVDCCMESLEEEVFISPRTFLLTKYDKKISYDTIDEFMTTVDRMYYTSRNKTIDFELKDKDEIQYFEARLFYINNMILVSIVNVTDLVVASLLVEDFYSNIDSENRDLSPEQKEIIHYLNGIEQKGKTCYKMIANEMNITLPTLRNRIKRLITEKYIKINKKGRNKYIYLTRRGKDLINR